MHVCICVELLASVACKSRGDENWRAKKKEREENEATWMGKIDSKSERRRTSCLESIDCGEF